MKFEQIKSKPNYTNLVKSGLAACDICGDFTRWIDIELNKAVCSEACCEAAWREYLSGNQFQTLQQRLRFYQTEINAENDLIEKYRDRVYRPSIDINIVVHNELDYLKQCIESIEMHTENYQLYIWDNGSNEETEDYLNSLYARVIRSEENVGFITSNNILAAEGSGDYIVLLNSDTEVSPNWDVALWSRLHEFSNVSQVGYLGGLLEENGTGGYTNFGSDIDYVLGWGFCIPRGIYQTYGLFDSGYQFAYFEDADLSLRLKDTGSEIYALYTPLVHHYGNKTASNVELDLKSHIMFNHARFKEIWKHYLDAQRVSAPRGPKIWGSPGFSKKPTQA